MNQHFSKNITSLRKERGLSQKQVAGDLNISQALLSHYEKGIRECGLDFLANAAKYFDVSCDYLLGVSKMVDENEKENPEEKAIFSSITIVFVLLKKINSKSLTKYVIRFLSCGIYTALRFLSKTSTSLFTTKEEMFSELALARMMESKGYMKTLVKEEKISLSFSEFFEKEEDIKKLVSIAENRKEM